MASAGASSVRVTDRTSGFGPVWYSFNNANEIVLMNDSLELKIFVFIYLRVLMVALAE